MSKKALLDEEPKQGKLLDVPRGQAAIEAERYADMCDDIAAKKDLLMKQGEKVVEAMKKSGQKSFAYNDAGGYKHIFTIVEGVIKLRHSKRQDA